MSQHARSSAGDGPNETILNAATRGFAASGFAGARVDDIAHDAGVNKATLYYRFGNKAALYAAVLERALGRLADDLAVVVMAHPEASDKLGSLTEALGARVGREPHLARLLLHELASGGGRLPPGVCDGLCRLVAGVHSIVAKGRHEGVFGRRNPVVLTQAILGGLMLASVFAPIRERLAARATTIKRRDIDVDAQTAAREFSALVVGACRTVEAE